eukprot:8573839-Alexandrium_andersonii.AAC.1
MAALARKKSTRAKSFAPCALQVPEPLPWPPSPGTPSTSTRVLDARASAAAGYSPRGPLKSPRRTMG